MKEVKKKDSQRKENHFYVKTEKFEKKGKNQEQERRGKRR